MIPEGLPQQNRLKPLLMDIDVKMQNRTAVSKNRCHLDVISNICNPWRWDKLSNVVFEDLY